MTTTLSRSRLAVRKHRGSFRVERPGTAETGVALRTRGGMRRGENTLAATTWPIAVNNFWRSGVTVGAAESPLVRLDTEWSRIPSGPVSWSTGCTVRGYHATISRGTDQITVRQTGFVGSSIEVEIVGTWEQCDNIAVDLVVLSASFALMARRRGKRLRTLAIVGAIGG